MKEIFIFKFIERNRRSVHRESSRPQGRYTPPKQFSPEMSEVVVDDAVNEAEVNTVKIATSKIFIERRGQRAWHVEEKRQELGRPYFLLLQLQKVGCAK